MPINPTDLAGLQATQYTGRPPCAEYLKVTWDTGVENFYASAAWNDEAPFTDIGEIIEDRLIPQGSKDPFHNLEINPDIRTETVDVTFDDIDKSITGLFQIYGSGVTCEFIYYYPAGDNYDAITTSVWQGQVQAPELFGWKQLKTKVSNGFRSREQRVPFRGKPRECSFPIFGGRLSDPDALATNGCDYDPANGKGLYKTGTTPFIDCPHDEAACFARWGHLLTFGGFNLNAAAMVTDPNPSHFYLAVSHGNRSALKEPIRVIFGTKLVRANPLLAYRPEINASNPDRGFVSTLWEICEGPVYSIYNFKINDRMVGQEHLNFRGGQRRQIKTGYAFDISNFNLLAHIFARFGWVNAAETAPEDLSSECMVQGFSEVGVYSGADPVTKTRQWSDDRVWCLLELYKNQRFGLAYLEEKCEIADWMTASAWGLQSVAFTATFPDGETRPFVSRRTSFNAILEGKPVGEQIESICRAGGLCIPFWHDGKLTIRPFREATTDELNNARTFYDKGQNVNICWSGERGSGEPMIHLSQTPDTKLVNEVVIRFEEASSGGAEREIFVRDYNQQLKAGRQLGSGQYQPVSKTYVGTGIVEYAEALRLGYRLLKYGEFDEGGTDNNLKLKITVPFEQGLGLKRYDIIKVVSDILEGFTLAPDSDLEETPEYFRILQMKRVGGAKMEITAQAYNRTSYEAFETDSVDTPSSQPVGVSEAGEPLVNGLYEYVGQVNSKPSYVDGFREIYNDGSKWLMTIAGNEYYETSDNTDFPWEATWIVGLFGIDPPPIVTQGVRFDGGGCRVAILDATYDPVLGNLQIEFDEC